MKYPKLLLYQSESVNSSHPDSAATHLFTYLGGAMAWHDIS